MACLTARKTLLAAALLLLVAGSCASGQDGSSWTQRRKALRNRKAGAKRNVDRRQLLEIVPSPPSDKCDNLKVVVGVMSVDKEMVRRDWVRETYKNYPNVYHWKNNPAGSFLVLFVVGQPPNNSRNAAVLYEEWAEHRDLVFLDLPENMNEGKSHSWMLKAWHLYGGCRNVKFFAKGDQDTFLRTPKLESKLLALPHDNHYYGWTVNVSSSYDGKDFNYSFAVGMFYALSPKLLGWVAGSELASQEKAGAEDMKTGYWLGAGGVPVSIVHDESCHDWAKTQDDQGWAWKPVTEESTVIHHVYTNDEFQELWARFKKDKPSDFQGVDWWKGYPLAHTTR
jgi:hypothetical protein